MRVRVDVACVEDERCRAADGVGWNAVGVVQGALADRAVRKRGAAVGEPRRAGAEDVRDGVDLLERALLARHDAARIRKARLVAPRRLSGRR